MPSTFLPHEADRSSRHRRPPGRRGTHLRRDAGQGAASRLPYRHRRPHSRRDGNSGRRRNASPRSRAGGEGDGRRRTRQCGNARRRHLQHAGEPQGGCGTHTADASPNRDPSFPGRPPSGPPHRIRTMQGRVLPRGPSQIRCLRRATSPRQGALRTGVQRRSGEIHIRRGRVGRV